MRASPTARTRPATIAAFLLLSLAAILRSSPDASRFLSDDPDTYMRLAVLEHQLTGPGLTDYLFPRDGAPFGLQIHWTLPFDLLVAALAAPLAPFLGWHAALAAAAIAVPFVSLAVLAASLAVLCRAIARPSLAPWAIALLAANPLITGYAELGMVNHHVLAVALGLLAIAAAIRLLRSMRPRHGAAAAFWSVLAVWESLECDLPVLLAAAIVVAAAALRRDHGGLRLFALLCPLFAALVLLLDPPPDGLWRFSADRFSLLQLTMFLAVGAAPLAAQAAAGRSARTRLLRAAAAACAVFLAWAIPAALLTRPFRSDDPLYLSYYWNSVAELQPAWSSAGLAFGAVMPGAIGLAIALYCLWRRPGLLWLAVTLGLGLEVLAGILSIRLATHAAAVGAILTAGAIRALLRRRRRNPEAALLALCLATTAAGLAALALRRDAPPSCVLGPKTAADLAQALPANAPDDSAIVAADLWSSPEILWRTRLRTVAGAYHRNWSGIADLARIFTGTDDAAIRAILTRRQAQAVVLCTLPGNVSRSVFPPESLARRLAANQIPATIRRSACS